MKLTAMDINNKEFKRSIRGYRAEEVDEFLDKIAEDYEVLYKENSMLKDKVTAVSDKVEHYAKLEATIQNTMILAQNAAEQAKVGAQKEAEFIIKNANDTAQRLLDKSHNEVLLINQDYDNLKQEFIKFRVRFRSFINAQKNTFEDLENDFIKNYNIGNVLIDKVKEKEVEEGSFRVKEISEDSLNSSEFHEIKNFFVKEE